MFEKVNIPDCIVVIGLVMALILAIFYALNELAMSIASGLLGYIGGTVKTAVHQKGEVFLNPGHAPNGHPDPGAVNEETGLRESDVALAVGKSAASYLNAAGVETELLQSDSLYEICETANSSDADIFVSIHCNAAEAEEANGTETWACTGSYRGSMLANCIQSQLVDALGTTDRGVKIATPGVNGLYVLTNTDMPAVLVELAFITNPSDEEILASAQDALARAVARGVTDYEQLILGGK